MRSGMVAVVGRPNVGKSSLVNALVGQKVSIVTPKPQTTRHRIQGVVNRPEGQVVFVDTPGIHRKTPFALNRYLNEAAIGGLRGVDVVLFVVEAGRWTDEDEQVLERVKTCAVPVGLVLNKVDKLTDKTQLLPEIEAHAKRHGFAFIAPVSAQKRDNLDAVVKEIFARLTDGPALYPEDQVTDRDLAFQLAETVREKLMQRLRQEVPYALTVEIEKLEREGKLTRVSAVIWIERDSQKAIVIGADGAGLKAIGTAARREMEYRLGGKVFLKLWVRVKEGWTDDPRALAQFGYDPT
ncbi:MAG: GTPase Era [Gammaproteobacteria bacterium]|nr:GTPase Era [Gammaproteobacteria bacterium]